MDDEQQERKEKRVLVRRIYEYSDGTRDVYELQEPPVMGLVELVQMALGVIFVVFCLFSFIAAIL